MARAGVPRYFLYGEAEQAAPERFIHIESVAERSGRNDWSIRPHLHAMLDHLLVIDEGRGEMRVEGSVHSFGPQTILVVPAGLAHGFRFDRGTLGHVITVADAMITRLATAHEPIRRLRERPRSLAMSSGGAAALPLPSLLTETMAEGPLGGLAEEALLHLVLVQACRLLPPEDAEAAPGRRAATLVARFGLQLDRRLREGRTITEHAAELGVSVARLRTACVEVTGQPPVRLLHARLLAEARRQLAYSDRGVAEIGFELGFEDPSYFSRFFRRTEGISPAAWRAGRSDR